MELYAGLDLHSRNTYIGIMDKAFNRVLKKVPNKLELILQTLEPFRDQIKGLWLNPPVQYDSAQFNTSTT